MNASTDDYTERSPIYVVLNAASGKRESTETESTIRSVLQASGRPHEILLVDNPNNLAEFARKAVDMAVANTGAVVAAGGDGTLNTIARATIDSGRPFGVIPLGTFNYFTRAQQLPEDTESAAKTVLSTTLRPVQAGLINGQLFLVNASLGLYPQLLEDREAFKQQFGRRRIVALVAGISTILQSDSQLDLQIEIGKETRSMRVPTLVIDNNRLQLEQLGLPEAPAVESGRLVAIAVKPTSRAALLRLMAQGALGRLGEAENVERFAFRRMTVRLRAGLRRPRVKVALDGETSWMTSPLTFEVAPKPLRLIVPDA